MFHAKFSHLLVMILQVRLTGSTNYLLQLTVSCYLHLDICNITFNSVFSQEDYFKVSLNLINNDKLETENKDRNLTMIL